MPRSVREVSCKALDPFLRSADKRGLSRRLLADGVGYPLVHLEQRDERIEWDAFRRFMRNVGTHYSDEQIVQVGIDGLDSPLVRSILIVGRVLLSAPGFYRWVVSSGGAGNLLYTNVVPSYREPSPDRIVVDLRLAPGYEISREFFLMAKGGFVGLPRALGLGSATVTTSDIANGMRFDISLPAERALRGRLRRLITRRVDARAAASELDDAMQSLEARYRDLEVARAAIERQRALLDTAYRLGHRIWGEREPAAIAELVVRSLVEAAGVAGARLVAIGGDAVTRASHGAVGSDGAAVGVELTGHRAGGRLEVWLGDADRDDAQTLLELLAPTVALAIDNAVAYRELEAYQKNLERLVEERTAELRQARDALAGTVDQLREAQGARERIFANISHEIRTPLTLILLAVADVEARAGAQLDAVARDDLSSVVDSARKLLRLVDELLLLAAGRETSLEVSPVVTELGGLIAALTATWRPAAEAAGLTLHHHAPASLVTMVDPVAIERVLTNLLSNAVKFTPRGGRISLEVSRDDAAIRIAVRDTGIGIDDDLRERLFGRFERGRGSAQIAGGSGIGLSLVKDLVEAHGGTIVVERIAAGGTEFVVTLPAMAASDMPAVVPRTDAPRLRPGDYGLVSAPVRSGELLTPAIASGVTILVAEDDPRLAAMVARLLSEEHNVVIALDGLAALALIRQHQPHLLVTDVDMPGMDGIELTRQFRAATGDRLAPVVILSALADPGTRLAGLGAGAVDYVVKPFDPAELRARVRSQLGMRDLALRLHRAEQLSALGTLSSGLAHELRNPANGIVNAIGPLRRLLPAALISGDEPVGQLLDVMSGCAEQIGFLSRQLLSFRRGGELELRMVALAEVVQRALTLAQPALKGVDLREKLQMREPVRCAPPLMVQVLTNLVENAAHAAGPGGWVEIASTASNGHVTVEIADSGPGVPVELRDRVFEPFFTTKPPGVGTGLGLPLARDIVHRHGGVLEIRERDQRAVFVVEFPHKVSP